MTNDPNDEADRESITDQDIPEKLAEEGVAPRSTSDDEDSVED